MRHFRCLSSFTFAGPRSLDDIIKKDMLQDKTLDEIAEIWHAYHQSKVRIIQ